MHAIVYQLTLLMYICRHCARLVQAVGNNHARSEALRA